MDLKKSYLGDGVYVCVENGMLKLTAENGITASDTIFLEPEVYEALVNFWNRVTGQTAKDEA